VTQEAEEFIQHYGVQGMKWGVRGRRRSAPRLSSDYKKTVPLRNRKTRELSNKQIQTVNHRVNLEQNYNRLNPNKVARGERVVKDLLAIAGTAGAVYTLAKSPHGQAAISNIAKTKTAKVGVKVVRSLIKKKV
jgi:predicted RNA-binding protein with PUA domain